MMFETKARTVSFQPTASFGPNTTGNSLYIDGVAASGDEPWLPVTTGRLGGAFKVRDEVLVNQQNQFDEIARSVVELFGEEDQVNAVKPKLAGMFTWDGGPAVPPTGVLEAGIALTIKIIGWSRGARHLQGQWLLRKLPKVKVLVTGCISPCGVAVPGLPR